MLCHIRELTIQIADVYGKILKYTDMKVGNLAKSKKDTHQHVITTTIGKLSNSLHGKSGAIDLSEVKCIVIDEADFFFSDPENYNQLKTMYKTFLAPNKNQNIQYVLFSATYPPEVYKQIGGLFGEASQIKIENS